MHDVLKGRSAVVTGAGRGLGAAIAVALAEAGVRVALAARTPFEIEGIAARILASGGTALAIPCDVTGEAAVANLAARATAEFGAIDLLVNNAGGSAASPFAKITLAEWNQMLAVNATAAFLTSRALLPAMVERRFGRIVQVASVAGLSGARYIAHYTAAKHALVGLTRALAAEVAGTGVTVNAVCPGYADTPMTARTVANVSARTGRSTEESLAAVLKSAGQRRLVTPAEVAAAVVELCAGDANGEVVVLPGGSREDLPFEIVNPAALGEPKGWNNGVVAPPGARLLFVAGQAGWENEATGEPPAFAAQFARALDKILAVVREAGGEARDVARLTVYVGDLAAYRDAASALGALWRQRFGTYYPAMALVEVRGFVDRGALVEIEATAALGGTPRS